MPVPARVRVEDGRPVRVTIDRPSLAGRRAAPGGGLVETAAGPWRTSGNWWTREAREAGGADRAGRASTSPHPPLQPWDRDEWDVLLADGATYRLFRERDTGAWFVEGVVD
jgi:hypothetical protein